MVNLTDNSNPSGNPYYFYQSDNPGLILVSQPLCSDNYNTWKRSMVMALSAKNKLGFVYGSIEKPVVSSADLLNSWTRGNDLVSSWLINSISKENYASLLYNGTASGIWQDLEDRYQQKNDPRIFQLKQKLAELTQSHQYVTSYVTQLKILWDELASTKPTCTCLQCKCGGIRKMLADQQLEYGMQFLMGLNDSYSQLRGNIISMDPLPSINKIFSLLVQEENQRTIRSAAPFPEITANVTANV